MIYNLCMTQELESKLKEDVIYPTTREINRLLYEMYNQMLDVAPELEGEKAEQLEALADLTTMELVEKIKDIIW